MNIPAILVAATAAATSFVESPRSLPVAAEVDVLVVGGTAAGVSAAKAAAEESASVFLAAGATYLGEDLAGTLELACDSKSSELERRLRTAGSAFVAYSYAHEPGWKPFGGWQYFNAPYDKLSASSFPTSPWDSVAYLKAASIYCTLDGEETVASIEVTVIENDDPEADASRSVDHRGAIKPGSKGPLTGAVSATFLDGEMEGHTIRLSRIAKTQPVPGIILRDMDCPLQHASFFSAELGRRAHRVRIDVEPARGAACHLVSRIRFRRPSATSYEEDPSPLVVKRTFDRVLAEAGVRFITGSQATDVLVDRFGRVAGAVVANRSGRQAIIAKSVVDATRLSSLSRAGLPPAVAPGGKTRFTWVASLPRPPTGFSAEQVGAPRFVHNSAFPTATLYRLSVDLPLRDWSYPSLAAAEICARRLFEEPDRFDLADLIRPVDMPPVPARAYLRAVPDEGGLGARIAAGALVGRLAAAEARSRAVPDGVSVEGAEAPFHAGGADVAEFLGGLRPYENSVQRKSVPSPSRELPVFGEYDVVVVGGGTSGAPAGIAAARAGAKTLVVEWIHSLGGVSTDGLIGGFYDTYHAGFRNEFTNACAKSSVRIWRHRGADVLRGMLRDAGADVWFGAAGVGALVSGDKVCGVVVATPLGRGVVKAKCVIDATGNSDIAAAAGAGTVFLNGGEIALQSAGQAPHRLHGRSENSDFGLVNDSDALDLWLFGVRSRAGAPDAWDIQRLIDSRERRRIVPDLEVKGWDVIGNRKFPDTVVMAQSVQDGHGYFTDEFGCVGPEDGSRSHFANVPLRSYLPKGLSGIASIGLGKGVSRDVLPFVRMRSALLNEGYAMGLAAADAAKSADGDFRSINVKRLQAKLVEKGNLPKEVLGWTDDGFAVSDAELAAAVESMPRGYHGSEKVMREKERALPLLVEAYRKASTQSAKQVYAMVLGLFGDATGAETLAEIVSGKRPFVQIREWGKYSFGRGMEPIGVAVALGRGRSHLAVAPITGLIDAITSDSTMPRVRAATLAAEAYAGPELADSLAAALRRPGIGGWARSGVAELSALGGYGVGAEPDRCIRELDIARALLACGDKDGLALRTFEAYAKDPRGVYAEHAAAVLRAAR